MPKTPIDYSKTIIYKLVHNEDYENANIYVGSTTDFVKRKCCHKTSCNNEKSKEYNEKKYKYIRNNGGWDCFNMIEIEKYNCNDGNEARAREEYWRCHFNSQLNMVRAYMTDEKKKEYNKEHYEQNKDKKLENNKVYYESHKDKYREYYENNKQKKKEKITCECGCISTKNDISRHLKSQRHLNAINTS